jgi:hypothetical protein
VNIPIQNIYYLLCYAWDKLAEKEVVDVDPIDSTSLADLFASVLINGTNHLLKRGFDRGYVHEHEWMGRLRGRICFQEAIRTNAVRTGRLPCDFDELSYNVLLRQACVAEKILRRDGGQAGFSARPLRMNSIGMQGGDRLGVFPREPLGWVCFHRGGMTLENGQVIERVDPVEPAGVDQAHEEVTHPGSVLRFVTEGVFSVEDRHLQGPFADVVGEGRSGHAQEQGQWLPVIEHVLNGFSQPGVGFDFPAIHLLLHPGMQSFHHGPALFLVQAQPLLQTEI